jgi:hypothetical protein
MVAAVEKRTFGPAFSHKTADRPGDEAANRTVVAARRFGWLFGEPGAG